MTCLKGLPLLPYFLQALVVLVHDMGPNWELVSDAINSALQIKVLMCNMDGFRGKGTSFLDFSFSK